MKDKKKILKPIKNKLTATLQHEKRNSSTDPCLASKDGENGGVSLKR